MKNSVSDRSIYVEEESDVDVGNDDVNEEGEEGEEGSKAGYESGSSDSSSDGSPRCTRPNSYTTSWPQSYRSGSGGVGASDGPRPLGAVGRRPLILGISLLGMVDLWRGVS